MQSIRAQHTAAPHVPKAVLAVVGPTAVGKSALAEEFASRHHGQVVSADSMQVYRGMDIGTAKTPAAERKVPYHCIDLVDPGQPFSAALYQRAAREAIAHIAEVGEIPVLVGGTGLYVRAALDPMEFPAGEQVANEHREHYENLAAEQGPEALHELLASRDPAAAELIHVNNVRRVVRALEMADQGVSYAAQAAGFSERRSIYPATFLGLTMDRAALYDLIDARVVAMIERGLLAEVDTLLSRGLRDALTAQQAIGYKELVPVVEGRAGLAEAVEAIQMASRRYAKRQLTWFRGDPRVVWLDVTGMSPQEAYEAACEAIDWNS